MSKPARYWTCRRVTNKVRCDRQNLNRARKCAWCGKPRPKKKVVAHRRALTDYTYEDYVKINGGTACAICGREPAEGKKHRRDHAHVGDGIPRGLLCWRHNLGLNHFGDDPSLLRAAADYLERAHAR